MKAKEPGVKMYLGTFNTNRRIYIVRRGGNSQ